METKRLSFTEVVSSTISGWWVIIHEFLLEPLIFTAAIVLVITKFQVGIEESSSWSEFLEWLRADMLNNPLAYQIFGIVFILWIVVKGFHIRSDNIKAQKQDARLERIETAINNLTDEIRQDRNERRNNHH